MDSTGSEVAHIDMMLFTCHFRWLPSSKAFWTSLLLCSMAYFARDDISTLELIRDGNGDTLISAGRKFELGFFDPNEDQQTESLGFSQRRYVGIWYYEMVPKIVVWVANRDSPLNDSAGAITIQNGNIQVLDGEEKSCWSTGLTATTSARTARLSDSGNLVFIDNISGEILWESFQSPTDTFLPGMKITDNLSLASWKSQTDPGIGSFIFQKNQQDQYVIRNGSVPYWVSGTKGMYVSYNRMPASIILMLSNFSGGSGNGYNISVPLPNGYNYKRLVMTSDGSIELRDNGGHDQHLRWKAPEDRCSIYNACGYFGSCNIENELLCRCLPGFMPFAPGDWDSGDFSAGCTQKSPSCSKTSNKTTFLSLKKMKIRTPETVDVRPGKNESDCRSDCLQDCGCLAYSYVETRNHDATDPICWIWRRDLSDLQELYSDADSILNVRVALSDIGYCVTREDKMLLYEYMPNKSLDYFIFDRALCAQLYWDIRFDIIMGIARGLLYLHEDSRLKIIHRDMKLSNILLDEEMNPKISDFGLARIFGSKQTEAVTMKVVGTYGYMSPEYALEGFFSVKSDVFSFGVMVLEIISGRRNTGFYKADTNLSLLGFTWKLWTEAMAMDLMDPVLRNSCKTEEFMKCLQTGLLCVQEDPKDRPTMSSVVHMFGSEVATLPAPKQPAFVLARGIESGAASSSNKQESDLSSSNVTLTVVTGR